MYRRYSHPNSTNPEHGVGMVKKDFLVAELGIETVETMRRIKVHHLISD
jgi:FAD/FMN-containing dehydrogenase